MKKWLKFKIVPVVLFMIVFTACKEKTTEVKSLALNTVVDKTVESSKIAKRPLSKEFKSYWYAGDAEITSYKLEQARYGEIREGKSVLIYVTEPFLPEIQVKANRNSSENIPVLKLNKTKKYLTGIYPYSIMSSTFYPVHDNQHALKNSLSVQEWCGHVYAQINNRETFEFTSHSYFEGEADQNLSLEKTLLENEIWTKIRINPDGLAQGSISVIPSLEYFRVQHRPVQAYAATASLTTENGVSTYTLNYNETERKLTIRFESSFPYQIIGWEEEFRSGYGPSAKTFTSRGTKLKTLKTPYWQQNSNEYISLRDSLEL